MAYLNLFIKDTKGNLNRLPFPVEATQPVFCWELPDGIVQKAFCLELKSRFPTTLSDGSQGFAYYHSSILESTVPEHQIPFPMYQNVWQGVIEVRIRIYGANGAVLYSTHESSDCDYPFEPAGQGYAWDSAYDGYYYLLDAAIEHVTGTVNPTFQWRNAEDEDEGQTISYQLQWSRTPLFLDGTFGKLNRSNTKTIDTAGKSGLYSTLGTIVDLEAPLFFRVRAYDGLDYGEWSSVNGFHSTPSTAPYCVFNWVESNCSSDDPNVILRPNGEIEISFRIVDIDTPIVSAYLTYKRDGIEYPCSLNCSTISVPSNEDIVVSWHSARQLPNEKAIIYLYLYAFDGTSESGKIVWSSPVGINNTGIGFGYNDSTNDDLTYRFGGTLRNYERWIQIPKEKAAVQTESGVPVYKPVPIPGNAEYGREFDWASYWSYKLGSELSKFLYAAAEQTALPYRGKVKRANWNIYDGYDGADRLDKEKLYLEYEDEFYYREKDPREYFIRYYDGKGAANLGRGIPSITYFMPPSLYGSAIRIRRPRIVKAGTSGVFLDGAAISNTENDFFASDSQDAGIRALKEKEIWKNFYQFDPMYYPGVKNNFTFLGPRNQYRYDENGQWYWTLFEYPIHLVFPFGINRGVNDQFAYRLNGIVCRGSLLENGENSVYFNYSPDFPSKLKAIFEKLFPTSIFQEIGTVDKSNNEYLFTVYSRWIDSNRTFQFADVENNCYQLFALDKNLRFSRREKSSWNSNNYVIRKPYADSKPSAVFEAPCDTGNCIGTDGEINTSEPLFTCDPVHLNQYGCHYKYTRARYLASGKVYVRKYGVKAVYMEESREPLRDKLAGEAAAPVMGYRNYHLRHVGKNSLGEDLFAKEELPDRIGGIPAKCKMIPVLFEKNEIEEQGWWKAAGDFSRPDDCISHEYDKAKKIYYRKGPLEYIRQIGFQDCFYTEYVELNEAWEKPFYDAGQLIDRIDKRQPVIHRNEIPQGYIQYILGAYKPPENQDVEISPYDYDFRSAVTPEEGWRLDRYNTYWDDSQSERFSEKQGIVVDPLLIEPKGVERTIEKWGYVPDHTLQTYFKEDSEGIWKDRVIPGNNSYVHAIYRENNISFPFVSRIHMFRRLISDVNRIDLPEEEGTKAPYLDYRARTGSPWEIRYYYSALPQEESPAYAFRPPEIYGEDRPLRISGFVDAMNIVVPWKVLYLQTEWNSYNLIHWEGSQDENVYAKIEVAEVDENGATGAFMTLKTKSAEWFAKYSCWLIPYVKLKQADYIDTLNGTFSSVQDGFKTDYRFENEKRYRFRVSGLNINSGAANTPVLSSVFTYSKGTYSPPVITDVAYNKWKREFTIEFRFDDVRGRKYDIINFYYATYEPGEASPPDSSFIQLGTDVLEGTLIDLDSNITGDNIVSEAYLIKHKVYFSSDILKEIEGKNIRFRLEGIASEDREGITAPVFNFRMWGNEFLKKADKQINSIVGNKNRWVYQTSVNDEGETVEQWVYVPEENAVIVPGTLAEQTAIIETINEKFEEWYYTVAKFEQPSFDSKYHCLCVKKQDNAFYSICFSSFIATLGLSSEWTQFKRRYSTKSDLYLAPLFIEKEGYAEDFSFFWDNRASSLLGDDEGFSEWFEENRVLSREEAKPLFLIQKSYSEDYQKYLADQSFTDDDDSRTEFITENSLQKIFESYYSLLNNYPDGRYSDRKEFVSRNYSSQYENWKQSPVDAYGTPISPDLISLEDDALRLFIAHDRTIWNAMEYKNSGKHDAKIYFLSVSENGVSYGQQLQTANSQITSAQNILNTAYAVRNHYESLHRRRLIQKGYFSNGWKNNQVYAGNKKNEVFRFRVENQPTSGKRTATMEREDWGGTYPEMVAPIAGYDTRWDIYFHFQMDFYDSFDSQNGAPLRDYLWQRLDCSGYAGSDADSKSVDGVTYVRIMGGIEADSGGMHILPDSIYSPASGEYKNSPTSNEPYSFQFAGKFSILKSELPGELEGDLLPEHWNTGTESTGDDFNQVYYWRVCPYNLVKKPVFEREAARIISIEYFAVSEWYQNKYWKAVLTNRFRGNFKYSRLAGNDIYYIWTATQKITPEWKRDSESACWNPLEAFYENFFPGTDENRADIEYTRNPVRTSYRSRILRGEIVFLTDRPREITDGSLQYIEETTDHFKSLWIPFNTERSKAWMFFDEDECCWFLISQKPGKNRTGYQEYVFTLSRGLSPQTFGEECQLFPASTMDSAGSVLPGAQSFENPCIVKRSRKYEIFFNVRKEEGRYETWRAESPDFHTWANFAKLEFDEEQHLLDPAVYFQEEQYVLYGVQGTSILKFTSEDGIHFVFDRNIYGDMYTVSRPALLDGRIYFGLEFGGRGKIISIAETGEYATLKVEKGSPSDFENSITFHDADVFFSPMVFHDYDKGTLIKRMIYEKSASVYIYNGTEIQESGLTEKTLFTEYLEEYSWNKVNINNYYGETDYQSSIVYITGNNYYPILKDKDGNKVNLNGSAKYIPVGKLELLFQSAAEPLQLKIPFFQESVCEEVESEGEWLDFYNIGETEAVLSPETTPEDYDLSQYTTAAYISEKGFAPAYSEWLRKNHPVQDKEKEENYRVEFLLAAKQYSLYLKWSRKGPGIYRYLSAVKRTSYPGDGTNV